MPSTQNYITQDSADARYQALGSLGSSTPSTVDAGDTGTAGASTSAARSDHEHPVSIGATWASYTPSNTNVTVGNGVQTARFIQIGKTIHWTYKLTFGTTTSFGGTVEIGLPVAAADSSSVVVGHAFINDASANTFVGEMTTSAASKAQIRLNNSASPVNATSPMTWTTSDALNISGTYEAA